MPEPFYESLTVSLSMVETASMVAFSSLLFHRSGPNTSHGVRKGYVIQYSVASARHGTTGEPFNNVVIAQHGEPVLS